VIHRPASLALVAATLVVGAGCKGDKAPPLAELVEVTSGTVDKRRADKDWGSAANGDSFVVGDAVRTSDNGGARLRFVGSGSYRMGPSTIIRFGQGTIGLEGELEAEEGGDLQLEFGTAQISKGGKIRVSGSGGDMTFDVLVGTATVSKDGKVVELGEGEGFDIEIGGSIVERVKPPDAGVPDAAPPADAAVEVVAGAITATIKGRGAKIKGVDEKTWSKLKPGDHELGAGTLVSLNRRTSMNLTRGTEALTMKGVAEFTLGEADQPLVNASKGNASVQATESDVRIAVPGGSIVVRKGAGTGGKAEINVGRGKTKITSRGGRTDVEGAKGGNESIQIGEWIQLTKTGAMEVYGRAPSFAHFGIPGGQTAFIHDPRLPSNVRIRFNDKCTGEGIVEISKGASFKSASRVSKGTGSAIIKLGPGSHRYRIRCIDSGVLATKAAASGKLRLDRSAGTRPLPKRAPTNQVDSDGRRYTVLYQNLLPSITFRWPNAATSSSYTLNVQPDRGRAQQFKGTKPSISVKTGKLQEGTYRYWFEGGGRQSKQSTLKIDFDNAAASGYLRKPGVKDRWGGGQLRVEGAAIKGWAVAVGSVPLPLDRQLRFGTDVAAPGGQGAIAIRFSHPKRGIHYYIRRNGGK
jgi:hypothetical protein